jgi:hypothetical protein
VTGRRHIYRQKDFFAAYKVEIVVDEVAIAGSWSDSSKHNLIITAIYEYLCVGTTSALTKSNTFPLEVVQMKKVLSTIVAALVAVSFSAVVFASDAKKAAAPAAAPAAAGDAAAPAADAKKEAKPAKKAKKAKKPAAKKDAAAPAAAPVEAPKAK